ncbi:bifunctional diguanylate cyclase/phosphodiesterase [Bacillus shivajii]|uniref:putative bifunctional diguanylate cyclase/phosphodiesterase n=1 Tax=Bacillus shivajii TaxID=1983719 RepID=UPI001CFA7BA2|nr:bifunctional diguanylate cyclase/phosphodiesterase [Bacillus shivajii]UCZ52068.1 bifunctional diguanylate cyclase/phosphodiesterase [Bacillus shivajii]
MPRFIHRSVKHKRNHQEKLSLQKDLRDSLSIYAPHKVLEHKFNEWKKSRSERSCASVISMTISRFQAINNTFGFHIGDAILQRVLYKLITNTPNEWQWVHLGDDKFLCLIMTDSTRLANVKMFCHQIKGLLEQPFYMEGYDFSLSIKFGSANFTEQQESFASLLKNANIALDIAKRNEKQSFELYSPFIDTGIHTSFEVESQLRKGISEGELELFYQPQWDFSKQDWGGLEVLVRWHHPKRGLLSPDKFIDIAEESGLIHPLGEWIVNKACENHHELLKVCTGMQFPVSINFSMKQLITPNFLESLLSIIKKNGLTPNHFVMELTESLAINAEEGSSILTKARKEGMKISIDDFGTGYSSLSYLKDLPIDEVKIDRSFLSQWTGCEKVQNGIIQSILHLAKVIGVSVVAEGIETKSQFDALHSWGCEKGQGFYLSGPMPHEKVVELMRNTIAKK